ncbi:MAG: NUDIX domain-containing protein [Gammaproteobacteria bacterium]|nr:NUDIX domain-containing protein [Gammaproteobacteria bacterium]
MSQTPVNSSAVAGVVLSTIGHTTRMLLLKRTKDGFWGHASGKLENNETAWQAILREIREETSLEIEALYAADYIESFYDIPANTLMLVPAFVAIAQQNATPRLNDENTEYRWCSREEAKAIVPFPNQQALYEHVWTHFVLNQPSALLKIV